MPDQNEQNCSSPEIDFNIVIKDLETEKAKLTAKVSELDDRAAAATELRRHAEKEADRLKEALQAKETDKLARIQKVQELTVMVDYWRSTMVKSADECLNRLKLELNAVMGSNFKQPMQFY